jgi:hypothetical protein
MGQYKYLIFKNYTATKLSRIKIIEEKKRN